MDTLSYDQYTDMSVSGKELKAMLKGKYFYSKQYRGVYLNLKIEDYLELLGIEDNEIYEISISKAFCKILNFKSTKQLNLFGYGDLNQIKLYSNFDVNSYSVNFTCPECGSKNTIKLGRNGYFISCSSYPKCKHSESINIIGTPDPFSRYK